MNSGNNLGPSYAVDEYNNNVVVLWWSIRVALNWHGYSVNQQIEYEMHWNWIYIHTGEV